MCTLFLSSRKRLSSSYRCDALPSNSFLVTCAMILDSFDSLPPDALLR